MAKTLQLLGSDQPGHGHIVTTTQLAILAIYSHETSQDTLSEVYNRQPIFAIQVHDKLHEKLLISTY